MQGWPSTVSSSSAEEPLKKAWAGARPWVGRVQQPAQRAAAQRQHHPQLLAVQERREQRHDVRVPLPPRDLRLAHHHVLRAARAARVPSTIVDTD